MDVSRFQKLSIVSKTHARKVKFCRFTCIQIRIERFTAKNCDFFIIWYVFESKNVSFNSIQSAESDEFENFKNI